MSKRKSNKYKCCITGEQLSESDIISLSGPFEGRLCFDFKHNLPGEHLYVKNSKKLVVQLVIERGTDQDQDLPKIIEETYLKQMLSVISLAKKSGQLIIGKEKIKALLHIGGIIIQAKDASVREKFTEIKLNSVEIYELFDSCDLSSATGKEQVVYVMLIGNFIDFFKNIYDRYNSYLKV